MMFNPDAWAWPHWAAAVLILLGILGEASQHGKPKVDTDGKPFAYNGFLGFIRAGLWVFLLTYGGFFAGRH